MEIRSNTQRVATINRMIWDAEAKGYTRETDAREITRYYGVEIVDGEEVIATGEYARSEDVPTEPEPGRLPADPTGFYHEAAATFGAAKADEWMLSSPSTIRAIDRGNYALARAGVQSARGRGILSQAEQDAMIALMDKYRLV